MFKNVLAQGWSALGGKKIFFLIFSVFIFLILTACFHQTPDNNQIQNQQTNTQTDTQNEIVFKPLILDNTNIDTAGWKIYNFFNNKYSFKYPEDWFINEDYQGDSIYISVELFEKEFTNDIFNIDSKIDIKNMDYKSLSEWLINNKEKIPPNIELLNINNINVIKINKLDYNSNENIMYLFLYNEFINLEFGPYRNNLNDNKFNKEDLEIINTIILSFVEN